MFLADSEKSLPPVPHLKTLSRGLSNENLELFQRFSHLYQVFSQKFSQPHSVFRVVCCPQHHTKPREVTELWTLALFCWNTRTLRLGVTTSWITLFTPHYSLCSWSTKRMLLFLGAHNEHCSTAKIINPTLTQKRSINVTRLFFSCSGKLENT